MIRISGMSCQGCVRNVTGVLSGLPGVAAVAVRLEPGEAIVSCDPARVSLADLRRAVEDAGFEAA